jgi:hypothetical protein
LQLVAVRVVMQPHQVLVVAVAVLEDLVQVLEQLAKDLMEDQALVVHLAKLMAVVVAVLGKLVSLP